MKSEKEILEGLKKKSGSFEMKVSGNLWDAIEIEIDAEAGRKRGAIFGWLGFALGGLALLTAYGLLLFGPLSQTEKDFVQNKRIQKDSARDSEKSIIDQTLSADTAAETLQRQSTQLASDLSRNKLNSNQSAGITENELGVESPDTSTRFSVTEEILGGAQTGEESIDTASLRPFVPVQDSVLIAAEEFLGEVQDSVLSALDKDELSANVVIEEIPKANRFSVILTGGIGSSYRTLESDVFHSLVDHKDSHETFGRAYKFGLQFEWKDTERLFLRSGLLYSRYSEHYEFHHDVISHATDNDYNYFQIPIIAGVQLANFKRSNISVLPGIDWNFLHSAQSSWVDPALLTPVVHSNADEVTPFRVATMGFSLALEYKWQINERINFHLSPGVDGFAHSVYKRNTELVQRPFAFNGSLGLSYSF